MFYIADLHLHSHYSRATSKDLNLETLYQWAKIKGINIIGTGDFTHPLWFKELKEKLEPDGSGFYKLKNPPKDPGIPGVTCKDIDVRFCLTTEISSIYKHGDKVRKNHNLLYAPDFEAVAKINAKLATIGNLEADGRPILGLPSRDLLEIGLNVSDKVHLIPAHVWTPWFSTLGSRGGYDSITACFRDLSDHIFALETGLSSDPEMNWKLSELDRYTLISNSDAHSPQKLGREANLFNTERSYDALFNAIKTKKGFLGTYEFFPEEGKYHLDGHRNCNVVFEPDTTEKHKGLCPVCGQPLTLGVLHRVEKLADRKEPQKPEGAPGFEYIIPLPEVIAEIKGVGPNSKKVQQAFQQTISTFGNEFTLLQETPIEDIKRYGDDVLSEAIRRMREHEVNPISGYDGNYGVIRIFNKGEIEKFSGQLHFFSHDATQKIEKRQLKEVAFEHSVPGVGEPNKSAGYGLNAAQEEIQCAEGAVLVKAGPGTGKTRTLMEWIAFSIEARQIKPSEILAVTFTNKAADELKERLAKRLGDSVRSMQIGTFHSICFNILQERYPDLNTVYDETSRLTVLRLLFKDVDGKDIKRLSGMLGQHFENVEKNNDENIAQYVAAYRDYLKQRNAIDLSDIIKQVIMLWESEPQWLEVYRKRYSSIAIDEFQDINPLQYRFLDLLGANKNILAIGDPDQAIYGFRGSDVKLFFQFEKNFTAKVISLEQNYRSTDIVLQAAGSLIRHNTLRSDLNLSGNKFNGEKIKLFAANDPASEVHYIANEIEKYMGGTDNLTINIPTDHHENSYALSDIAILFRTRAIGKEVLTHLKKYGIPTQYCDATSLLSTPPFSIIGDIFRIYLNPKDVVSFDSLFTKGLGWPDNDVLSLLKIIDTSSENLPDSIHGLSGETQKSLKEWQELYHALPEIFKNRGTEGAIEAIFEQYIPDISLDDSQLLKKDTILTLARESQADVEHFLQKMTLNNHTDIGQLKSESVNLLTFHAAKGLEFPIVFIVGTEEGVTPINRADTDLEEERRLFYVALTRAQEAVQITYTRNRRQYGRLVPKAPSRFIQEIPPNLKERIEPKEKKKVEKPDDEQLSLF
ncbi:UvrD-helicase domain-containing protein [Fulvivirgaceae bacterium BMA10]|uniref:UvrD-helicase domain-containing protein n=1 Tax=Splendidivirga corallicola TaxID=3051826 RepID=A0ABT8KXU0_9BACT|nr:UvrD-helicase domain-containing protein [Fulvivirgaceae bacterium BMA10]